MFSKKDYEGYFRQLAAIEGGMIKTTTELLAEVTDEPVRAVLRAIQQDEFIHAKLVAQMRVVVAQTIDF